MKKNKNKKENTNEVVVKEKKEFWTPGKKAALKKFGIGVATVLGTAATAAITGFATGAMTEAGKALVNNSLNKKKSNNNM